MTQAGKGRWRGEDKVKAHGSRSKNEAHVVLLRCVIPTVIHQYHSGTFPGGDFMCKTWLPKSRWWQN